MDLTAILAQQGRLLALARAASRVHADDVVQDALCAGVRRGLRGHALGRWLRRAVRSRAADLARADARRRRREQRAARPEAMPSTEELVMREQLRRRVAEAVIALDEPYRSAVWRRFFEDRSVREIARAAGVPEKTVHTRLRRALAQLRGRLDRDYGARGGWLGLLLPLAGTPGLVTLAIGVPMKKLVVACAGLALALLAVRFVLPLRADASRPPAPPAAPALAAGTDDAADGGVSARTAVLPAAAPATEPRTATVLDAQQRPAAGLTCWRWRERPKWVPSHYSHDTRFPPIRGTLPAEPFRVGGRGSEDDTVVLDEEAARTDPEGRVRLGDDDRLLAVRADAHLLVVFDLPASGSTELVLPGLVDVDVRFAGARSDDRLSFQCDPVWESPRTGHVQEAGLLGRPVRTPSGDATVVVAAFELRDLAPADFTFRAVPGVLLESYVRGPGLVLREAQLRARAPQPFAFTIERHAASVEVAVHDADGVLARDVHGQVRWRSPALKGGAAWQPLSDGIAVRTFQDLAAPAPVEVDVWLADGERLTHTLELTPLQRARVELVRGTGDVSLAIAIPAGSAPRQLWIEHATGGFTRAGDTLLPDGPCWLVAGDVAGVDALPADWHRLFVVMREGRIAVVDAPAHGRVTPTFLPDGPLEPFDVATYARAHDARRLLLHFLVRLVSHKGIEQWVCPDFIDVLDTRDLPVWHKRVPLACDWQIGAMAGDRTLPPPRLGRQ